MTVIGRRSYSIITQLSLYLLYMNMLIAQKGDIFNWWNVGVYKVEYPPPPGGDIIEGKGEGKGRREKGRVWKREEKKKGMRKGNKGKAREKGKGNGRVKGGKLDFLP